MEFATIYEIICKQIEVRRSPLSLLYSETMSNGMLQVPIEIPGEVLVLGTLLNIPT